MIGNKNSDALFEKNLYLQHSLTIKAIMTIFKFNQLVVIASELNNAEILIDSVSHCLDCQRNTMSYACLIVRASVFPSTYKSPLFEISYPKHAQNQATYLWLQYSKNSFNSRATTFRFQSKHYWMAFGQDTGQVNKMLPTATVELQG